LLYWWFPCYIGGFLVILVVSLLYWWCPCYFGGVLVFIVSLTEIFLSLHEFVRSYWFHEDYFNRGTYFTICMWEFF